MKRLISLSISLFAITGFTQSDVSSCVDKKFRIDVECKCKTSKSCFSIPKKVILNDVKRSMKYIDKEKAKKLYGTTKEAYSATEKLFSGVYDLKKLNIDKINKMNKKLDRLNKKLDKALKAKIKSSGAKFIDNEKYMKRYNKKLKKQFSDKDGNLIMPNFSKIQKKIYPNFDMKKMIKSNPDIAKNNLSLASLIPSDNYVQTNKTKEEPEEIKNEVDSNGVKIVDTSNIMKKRFKYKSEIHDQNKDIFSVISNRYALVSYKLFGEEVKRSLLNDQKKKALFEFLGTIQLN